MEPDSGVLRHGAIASLVQRFREAPALPASERPSPGAGLWWRGSAPRPESLVSKSLSTDLAVDGALHAFTSTMPPPRGSEDGSGDVISRALAVIRESRAMYESGVLRGLPPTAPLSHEPGGAAAPPPAFAPAPDAPGTPPAAVRSLPPSRKASLGSPCAAPPQLPSEGQLANLQREEDREPQRRQQGGADADGAGGSGASDANLSYLSRASSSAASLLPPRPSSVFLTSAMPLGYAIQIPSLAPSEFLSPSGSFRRRPRAPEGAASGTSSEADGSKDSSRALTASYWEDREEQLLGAIHEGLESALSALKSPPHAPHRAAEEGKAAEGSVAHPTGGGAGGAVGAGSGRRRPSAAPGDRECSSAAMDDLMASAEAIRIEDPEVTLARLRRRLMAVDDASASALAPYTSMFQAAKTALHAQARGEAEARGRGPPASSSSSSSSTSSSSASNLEISFQPSLLGQTTIAMLNSTSLSVESTQSMEGAARATALASAPHPPAQVADALVQTGGESAGGGAPRKPSSHGKHHRKHSRARRASSTAAAADASTTPALLQKLRAAIDVAGGHNVL